jgi:acetylornithine deacetylase/succinyl-diaminopimelate desuccinylase-like protein
MEATHMTAVETYLRANRARVLDDIVRFIAIPSVSTDPAHTADVRRAADFVAAQLRGAGLADAMIHSTPGHPIVTASWRHAPGQPTVLIYGHFDVQPPDPLQAWHTPPFSPVIREARLYGRGASDDKGPMMIPIKVVEAYLATQRRLPVNLVFLFEGEEEVSSAHLGGFIAANKDLLAADFALSADGAQWRADLPSLITGSRGICALELEVFGASKDLHSGRHGGAVANPIQALVRLLAALHDEDGKVAVPGFYDEVAALPPGEIEAIAAIPFDEAGYLRAIGAAADFGEAGYGLLQRNWIRPTLEFNGIGGGYAGPGKKTVIPSRAMAKISCRLVPDQAPEVIAQRVADFLRAKTPPGVRLALALEAGGARPYAIAPDHPGLVLAEAVLQEVTGIRPRHVRMGATVPFGGLLKDNLGIDTVFFSFATSDEDYHAPNEFFRLSSLDAGLAAWSSYLRRLARP